MIGLENSKKEFADGQINSELSQNIFVTFGLIKN